MGFYQRIFYCIIFALGIFQPFLLSTLFLDVAILVPLLPWKSFIFFYYFLQCLFRSRFFSTIFFILSFTSKTSRTQEGNIFYCKNMIIKNIRPSRINNYDSGDGCAALNFFFVFDERAKLSY